MKILKQLVLILTAASAALSAGCAERPQQQAQAAQIASNGEIVALTDATFEQIVLASDQVVIVDFWAEWCAPCKKIKPHFDAASKAFAGQVRFASIDVDEHQKYVNRYQVFSLPTLLIFKNGKLVDRMRGLVSRAEIDSRLNKHLAGT